MLALDHWCIACVDASFPQAERLDALAGALWYLAWLDTLPCTTDERQS